MIKYFLFSIPRKGIDFLLRDEKITQTDDFDYLLRKDCVEEKKNTVEKFVYANFSYSTIKYSDEKCSDHSAVWL